MSMIKRKKTISNPSFNACLIYEISVVAAGFVGLVYLCAVWGWKQALATMAVAWALQSFKD